jgi:filamin
MADGYGNEKVNPKWVEVQKKAFTRWMNQYLSSRMLKVENMEADLKDGTTLINLLEVISAKPLGHKWNRKPKMQMQMQENLNMAIQFIQDEGLKLVNIGSADVYNGNTRIILGLIWTLILRYQIQTGIEEGSPKWHLLQWVKKQVKPYGVPEPTNFTSSWVDGQTLGALTDSLKPGVYDMSQCDPSGHPVEDIQRAIDTAQREYSINPIIDAPDMNETPDELAIMTYVSYFRDWLENEGKRRQTPSAKNTTASGPGVEGGRAKVNNAIRITAINQYNQAVTVGGATFFVEVNGPSGAVNAAPITDNGNGTYDTGYTPEKAGHYHVKIAFNGEDIKGSVFNVLMEGANAGNTWADGPGLHGGKTGRDLPFTIHGVDADGNKTTDGGEPYQISISGPHGPVSPRVKDNGDGTVDVSYNVDQPGDYKIAVSLHDQPIKDSPWKAHVKASPDASKSWAEGPGLEKAFDNEPAFFTVFARDANGNPVSGDDCEVSVKGPGAAHANVTDNGDGTYSVEYNVEDAGKYNITATLDGAAVKNTPKTVEVIEGADAGNASVKYTITVQAKNKKGEPKTYGGDSFEVNVKGGDDESEVECEAIDNGDGTYSAKYELEGESGTEFKVYIKLNGHNIKGSPFKHKL